MVHIGEQSNNPDSSGLLVLFSIGSSLSSPSLLAAGAVSNHHLRLERQNAAELCRFLVYWAGSTRCPAFAGSVWSRSGLIYSSSEGVPVGGRAKSTAGNTRTDSKGHQPEMEIQTKLTCPALRGSYTIAVDRDACLNF